MRRTWPRTRHGVCSSRALRLSIRLSTRSAMAICRSSTNRCRSARSVVRVTHSVPPVAVVTGASRGAGRGIAAALVADGWRVYLTGRTVTDPGDGGIAVQVDHTDDAAVGALFARVEGESGRLDLLVNNAAAIHDDLTSPKPFWEKTLELADVLDVGLRSAYAASWHAASLLVRQDRGLIAFTSSPGSVCYMTYGSSLTAP